MLALISLICIIFYGIRIIRLNRFRLDRGKLIAVVNALLVVVKVIAVELIACVKASLNFIKVSLVWE